jgi:hypothetical protein
MDGIKTTPAIGKDLPRKDGRAFLGTTMVSGEVSNKVAASLD